jgi:hypothetical protein
MTETDEEGFMTMAELHQIILEEVRGAQARCKGLAERCETTTAMKAEALREIDEAQRRTIERVARLCNVRDGAGNA